MLSLDTIKTHIPNPQKALSLKSLQKRASLFSSFSVKASMALEGSLVLPVFLFYMVTILYCLEIVRFQSDVFEAMHQAAGCAWISAYENVQEYQADSRIMSPETGKEVKADIIKYLDGQQLPYFCVEGKRQGMNVKTTVNYMGKGNLEIVVSYQVKDFINWLPIGDIQVKDHLFVHGFVGYMGNPVQGESEKETYVYITPSGTKYHCVESCTYLKVRLQIANPEEIERIRNDSGEIYRPCEVCKPQEEGLFYYTQWGNRYHGKSTCNALKRTVYLIPISQVGSRTACSKCG